MYLYLGNGYIDIYIAISFIVPRMIASILYILWMEGSVQKQANKNRTFFLVEI